MTAYSGATRILRTTPTGMVRVDIYADSTAPAVTWFEMSPDNADVFADQLRLQAQDARGVKR